MKRFLLSIGLLLVAVSPLKAANPGHMYDPDVTAYLAAQPQPVSDGLRAGTSLFVHTLKACGSWDRADWRLLLYNTSQAGSLINVMAPTQSAVVVGTPTFVANSGATPGWTSGSAGRIEVYNPGNGGTYKFKQNDAAQMINVNTTGAEAGVVQYPVASGAAFTAGITARNSAGDFRAFTNSATSNTFSNTSNQTTGMFGWARTGASAAWMFRNGAVVDTISTASIAVANNTVYLLQGNGTDYSTKKVTYYMQGAAITPRQFKCEIDAYTAFVAAVGTT